VSLGADGLVCPLQFLIQLFVKRGLAGSGDSWAASLTPAFTQIRSVSNRTCSKTHDGKIGT
jgi:hypothetical protein